jgi:hypothetical protein
MFQLRPERMDRYPPEKYREARGNLDLFSRALQEGAEAGIFDRRDPDVLASTIWASLHGTVSLLLADRVDARIEPETFIDAAIQRTLRGCRQSVASSPK